MEPDSQLPQDSKALSLFRIWEGRVSDHIESSVRESGPARVVNRWKGGFAVAACWVEGDAVEREDVWSVILAIHLADAVRRRRDVFVGVGGHGKVKKLMVGAG